ncbi:unnamed protein product [Bemisia tabaci]|uniref:Ima1 N-terminal domain-containing protein n=1 Tax=Bemisia tabaci TaxID=7038 RepID=A0A9P0EWQ4_BEMTA|nr:unnamed protein product [Bemisia tabaci]
MDHTMFEWNDTVLSVIKNPVFLQSCLVACVSIALLWIALKTFKFLRSQFPTSVNCWFCNSYSKVPVENKNSWHCEVCQQYNGFAEDGGYNKVIPEQHYESLNPDFAEKTIPSPISSSNGLCRNCNLNQELKRAQLASFEPLDPNNYDWEVDAFSELLEKNYKLCPYCEKIVCNTLENQIKNLNISHLITTASHKLATSSVRFLNHQSTPVDLNVLLRSSRNSLFVSGLLSMLLSVENYDNSALKTALNGKMEEIFNMTNAGSQFLMYTDPVSTYFLDNQTKFNLVVVIMCSAVQILKRYDNRTFLDYITQFSWMAILCLQASYIFIKSSLDIRSIQILILALIFTVSLWKFVYFKFFFFRQRKSSPKSNKTSPMTVPASVESTKIHPSSPPKISLEGMPQPTQRDNTKMKSGFDQNLENGLGIGSLNLGPSQSTPSNRFSRNVFSVSHDSFPSKRKPLILPSRLNINLKNELSEVNLPFSRPSSQSSGYETMNKSGFDSQNGSITGDEDYDVPLKSSLPLQVSNYRMSPPFMPPAPSPYELYTYYHFTAKFQASYGGQSPHNLSSCSSCVGSTAPLNSNKWFLLVFLMFLFIVLQESFILYSLLNR